MSTMVSTCLAALLIFAGSEGNATPPGPPEGAVTESYPPLIEEIQQFDPIPRLRRGSAAPVVSEFLSSPDPAVRLRGIEGIEDAAASPFQLETLLKALYDESPVVRAAAARRLGEVPPEAIIALVWEAGTQRPAEFWKNFWRHVPDWKSSLAGPLTAYLEREDIAADQAAMAAVALGLMRHGPAGELLANRAWVRHEELAYRASEALLRLGEAGPREEQRKLLRHPMPAVRHMAVFAVAQHGDQDAMDALHAVVMGTGERSLIVRKAAVTALSTMEWRTVLPVLVDLMQKVPGLNWEIRQALIVVAEVDNGRNAATWREWYEALQLYEAGHVEEANRRLDALQDQRSLRIR